MERIIMGKKISEVLAMNRVNTMNLIQTVSKRKPFPQFVLKNATSGICFYSVGILGVRDVIHFYNKEIKDVTLVDHDTTMMQKAISIYPKDWRYLIDDVHEVRRRLINRGEKFDVVVIDPWAGGQIPDTSDERLKEYLDISNKYFVFSASVDPFFKSHKIEPTVTSLASLFREKDKRIKKVTLTKCTSWREGMYWITLWKK